MRRTDTWAEAQARSSSLCEHLKSPAGNLLLRRILAHVELQVTTEFGCEFTDVLQLHEMNALWNSLWCRARCHIAEITFEVASAIADPTNQQGDLDEFITLTTYTTRRRVERDRMLSRMQPISGVTSKTGSRVSFHLPRKHHHYIHQCGDTLAQETNVTNMLHEIAHMIHHEHVTHHPTAARHMYNVVNDFGHPLGIGHFLLGDDVETDRARHDGLQPGVTGEPR